MTQVKQNNIIFDNVKTNGVKLPSWPLLLSKRIGPDNDGGIVNAVDIDWNDAKLNIPNLGGIQTISTTGDLLNILKKIAESINIYVENIVISNNNLFIPINGTNTVTATLEPNNVSNKNIIWTSSDSSIASTVNKSISEEPITVSWNSWGNAILTASAEGDPSKKAICNIVCEKPDFFYIGLSKPTNVSNLATVNSYKSEYIFTNESGEKCKIYVLVKSEITVRFYETVFNLEIDKNIDNTTIPGFSIYETAIGIANYGEVKIKLKF